MGRTIHGKRTKGGSTAKLTNNCCIFGIMGGTAPLTGKPLAHRAYLEKRASRKALCITDCAQGHKYLKDNQILGCNPQAGGVGNMWRHRHYSHRWGPTPEGDGSAHGSRGVGAIETIEEESSYSGDIAVWAGNGVNIFNIDTNYGELKKLGINIIILTFINLMEIKLPWVDETDLVFGLNYAHYAPMPSSQPTETDLEHNLTCYKIKGDDGIISWYQSSVVNPTAEFPDPILLAEQQPDGSLEVFNSPSPEPGLVFFFDKNENFYLKNSWVVEDKFSLTYEGPHLLKQFKAFIKRTKQGLTYKKNDGKVLKEGKVFVSIGGANQKIAETKNYFDNNTAKAKEAINRFIEKMNDTERIIDGIDFDLENGDNQSHHDFKTVIREYSNEIKKIKEKQKNKKINLLVSCAAEMSNKDVGGSEDHPTNILSSYDSKTGLVVEGAYHSLCVSGILNYMWPQLYNNRADKTVNPWKATWGSSNLCGNAEDPPKGCSDSDCNGWCWQGKLNEKGDRQNEHDNDFYRIKNKDKEIINGLKTTSNNPVTRVANTLLGLYIQTFITDNGNEGKKLLYIDYTEGEYGVGFAFPSDKNSTFSPNNSPLQYNMEKLKSNIFHDIEILNIPSDKDNRLPSFNLSNSRLTNKETNEIIGSIISNSENRYKKPCFAFWDLSTLMVQGISTSDDARKFLRDIGKN